MCRVHVIDPTLKAGEFEDTSDVRAYEMEDADYEAKEDSVLAWKKKNKMGRFDEEKMAQVEAQRVEYQKQEEIHLVTLSVGARFALCLSLYII